MMKKITMKDKLKMYWYGLSLKPKPMMGNSGKCTYVVCSSHPLYSITWTWALYWTKPSCWKFKKFNFETMKEEVSFSVLYRFGFSLSKQDVMIKPELKSIW